MEGIQFVINDKGEKTAVIIDLIKHGELWEEFYDNLIVKMRKNEPVKEELEQHITSITEQLCGSWGEEPAEDYDFHIELERFGGDINAGK